MKKGEVLKKGIVGTLYFLLFLILLAGVTLLVSGSVYRENGNIVNAQGGYRNINPKFSIDFINNQYIRFESSKSYKNPFEEKEENIWERIKYYLGIDRERKGLELSLEEVSYDTKMTEMTNAEFEYTELGRNFELIQSGNDIYNEDTEVVSKDTIISKDIYKGVDIEYQVVEGKGLKEEIVLEDLQEYSAQCDEEKCRLPVNRYVFKITLDEGLELKKSVTGTKEFPAGTYYITDSEGNYFAHFLPEFAKDAVGNKTTSVYVNITPADKKGEYKYELIVNAEWLLSSERIFPVRIDPSIVHDNTLLFDAGTYDRTINSETNTIDLQEGMLSGEYASGILPLGGSTMLDSIVWTVLGASTSTEDEPYSRLGLLVEENFDNLISDIKKWGQGAFSINTSSQQKTFPVHSSSSSYFSIEFWIYQKENISALQEYIFKSNLGSLSVKEGYYTIGEVLSSHPVEYNKWQHITVVFDLNNDKAHLYIDGKGEEVSVDYGDSNTLTYVSIGGTDTFYGYIDTLRIYDRLLTRYEVASNTQYSHLYMTYRTSSDGIEWSDWKYNKTLVPEYEVKEEGVYINTDTADIYEYNLLSFLYAEYEEKDMYITKWPVEGEVGTRENKYAIKSAFAGSLNGTFTASENKKIYAKEDESTSNYIQNLNTGDIVIVEEVVNDEKYSVEGEVISVNKATGLIEVKEWTGNIPAEGFSSNARVYKWEKEYISLSNYNQDTIFLKSDKDIQIKDITLYSAYENTSPVSDMEIQFLQYKYIFTTSKPYLTPHLSSVNINYSSAGPAMDQIMRHGKWFDEEGKQSFWWAR